MQEGTRGAAQTFYVPNPKPAWHLNSQRFDPLAIRKLASDLDRPFLIRLSQARDTASTPSLLLV